MRWKRPILGLIGLLGLVTVLGGGQVMAQQRVTRPPTRTPAVRSVSPCELTIEDAGGRSLATYHQRGRTFVLGEQGDRYVVRVQNRSAARVEAVITVDGRDAITGGVGDYHRYRGYVIAPHDSVRVEGFRQSLEHVATFRFAPQERSYSARLGTPENVGVIGVACFTERRPVRRSWQPVPRSPAARRSPPPQSEPAEAKESSSKPERSAQHLGTEYGETRYSAVSTTTFVRESPQHPRQILAVYYDDAAGLSARGIRLYPRVPVRPPTPRPFPGVGFAPPPP